MSDLVGNPKDQFSSVVLHIEKDSKGLWTTDSLSKALFSVKSLRMSVPHMDRTDSSAAMASLATYADPSDSEDDDTKVKSAVDAISDEEVGTATPTPTPISNTAAALASKIVQEHDNDSRSSMDLTEHIKPRKKKSKCFNHPALIWGYSSDNCTMNSNLSL